MESNQIPQDSGTNKRIAKPRPRNEWQVQDIPELRIVNELLWERVHQRQQVISARYSDSGKKHQSRSATSSYLLSGFLLCGTCGAKLIIVSGGKQSARYGCPQAWNRHACSNKVTVRHTVAEARFFEGLQEAVLTPAVLEYVVGKLMSAMQRKKAPIGEAQRTNELTREIEHLVGAIASVGYSEGIAAALRAKEAELRFLKLEKAPRKEITEEDLRKFASDALNDIPALLRNRLQQQKPNSVSM